MWDLGRRCPKGGATGYSYQQPSWVDFMSFWLGAINWRLDFDAWDTSCLLFPLLDVYSFCCPRLAHRSKVSSTEVERWCWWWCWSGRAGHSKVVLLSTTISPLRRGLLLSSSPPHPQCLSYLSKGGHLMSTGRVGGSLWL